MKKSTLWSVVFLVAMMSLSQRVLADASGTCGNNLKWIYIEVTKALTIEGTGKMDNYGYQDYNSAPWYDYRSGIEKIFIGTGITSIGDYAFYNCSAVNYVYIYNSVTSIGSYAFLNCTGLISITIPNSVTYLGRSAFSRTDLSTIVVDSGNTVYDSRENCNAIIETSSNTLVFGCKTTTIPNSVTSIGSYAFSGCTGLISVTIPNSVTSIEMFAFSACTGLTSITIPNNVTSIGDWAFEGCSGLTSIVVVGKNTVYDSRNNCNAIIETSSNSLLFGCQNTIIPNSVTTIGGLAFCDCTGLTSITIPNSVTSIGASAFSRCTGLTSIIIPNSVTSIGASAFNRCTGLTSIIISNSVTSIEMFAFSGCRGLKDFYCYAEQIPSTESDVFYDTLISDATLHVPAVSLSKYKKTSPWKDFGSIVALTDSDPQPNNINVVNADRYKTNVHYDLLGYKIQAPKLGIYIMNGKKYIKR